MPPDAGRVPVAVGTDQADRSFTVDSFSEWRQRMCTRFVRLDATTDRPEGFRASFRGSQVERWGFVDAGHFSRSFTSAYGVSPREYRLRWPARSG